MKMDHAFRLAEGQPVPAEHFLSTAGRLARNATPDERPDSAGAPWPPLAGRATGMPLTPDNLLTLRACQNLLNRTLTLLE